MMRPNYFRSLYQKISPIAGSRSTSMYSISRRDYNVPPINDDTAAYELCTLDIKPANFTEFLQLSNKYINSRLKYGPLVGCWTTDIGGTNQVVQLWKYADLDHRQQAHIEIQKDAEIQKEYQSRLREIVISQSQVILNKFPWASLSSPPNGQNIWELRQYTLKPGNVPIWGNTWVKGLEARSKLSKPYGVFFSEFGTLNQVVHLWPYKSHNHRAEVRRDAVKDPLWKNVVDETLPLIDFMQNKVLIPVEFSPVK